MLFDKSTVFMLETKLLVTTHALRDLADGLGRLEADEKIPLNQKLEEIKKIRQKIDKVAREIDSINKEVKFLKDCCIN